MTPATGRAASALHARISRTWPNPLYGTLVPLAPRALHAPAQPTPASGCAPVPAARAARRRWAGYFFVGACLLALVLLALLSPPRGLAAWGGDHATVAARSLDAATHRRDRPLTQPAARVAATPQTSP